MSTCQKSQPEREVNSIKFDGLEVQTRMERAARRTALAAGSRG